MQKRGITLVELTLVMLICSIMLLVMTCQFLATQGFLNILNNQNANTQDAALALNHMTRLLRFATSPSINADPDIYPKGSIKATIEGGHNLAGFNLNRDIEYGVKGDGALEYIIDPGDPLHGPPVVIACNVTSFSVTWEDEEFTINLTVKKGNQEMAVSTKIYSMPMA